MTPDLLDLFKEFVALKPHGNPVKLKVWQDNFDKIILHLLLWDLKDDLPRINCVWGEHAKDSQDMEVLLENSGAYAKMEHMVKS